MTIKTILIVLLLELALVFTVSLLTKIRIKRKQTKALIQTMIFKVFIVERDNIDDAEFIGVATTLEEAYGLLYYEIKFRNYIHNDIVKTMLMNDTLVIDFGNEDFRAIFELEEFQTTLSLASWEALENE